MIIKKQDKKTGKINHSSSLPNHKAVEKDGKWVEVKMSQKEIANRDHGEKTKGTGAVGSGDKQRGVSKSAIAARSEQIQKEKESSEKDKLINNVQKDEQHALKKVQPTIPLTNSSIKTKTTDKHQFQEGETLKNPLTNKDVSPDDLINLEDLKKLKARNSFYIKDAKKQEEKMKKSIDDKMLAMLGPVNKEECKKEIKEIKESSIMDRLRKVEEIASIIKKPALTNSKDIVDRINQKFAKKLEEADDEDAPEDKPKESPDAKEEVADELEGALDSAPEGEDTGDEASADTADTPTEDAPEDTADAPEGEGSGLDLESGVKDETPAKPNQLSAIIQGSSYDLKANNVYDFYDLVIDKLSDETARNALNMEYQKIPENQRKVQPAQQLYNTVVKRLDTTNKSQESKMEELEGGAGGEGEDLGGGGGEDELKL